MKLNNEDMGMGHLWLNGWDIYGLRVWLWLKWVWGSYAAKSNSQDVAAAVAKLSTLDMAKVDKSNLLDIAALAPKLNRLDIAALAA